MKKTLLKKNNLNKRFIKEATKPMKKSKGHLMNPLKKRKTWMNHNMLKIKAMMIT
jgi:hypothetical protein